MASKVDQLITLVDSIEDGIVAIYRNSRIDKEVKPQNPFSNLSGGHRPLEFRNRRQPLDEKGLIAQQRQIEKWEELTSSLQALLPKPTYDLHASKEIMLLSIIVNYRSAKKVPDRPTDAISELKEVTGKLRAYLTSLKSPDTEEILIIPDTNVFINMLNPGEYADYAKGLPYKLILSPTLTHELDTLKNDGRKTEEFREKVRTALRRIKGWRDQGRLTEGIKVEGVTVRQIASEPDLSKLPIRLNPSNQDDLLIGTVMELMKDYPADSVIVITSDLTLQGKLEQANIDFEDIE